MQNLNYLWICIYALSLHSLFCFANYVNRLIAGIIIHFLLRVLLVFIIFLHNRVHHLDILVLNLKSFVIPILGQVLNKILKTWISIAYYWGFHITNIFCDQNLHNIQNNWLKRWSNLADNTWFQNIRAGDLSISICFPNFLIRNYNIRYSFFTSISKPLSSINSSSYLSSLIIVTTSRKKGFRFELLGALAPVVLWTQTKGCISTGS
jgi:hypothetical protein